MTGVREWQLMAAEQQQTFYNQLGDRRWDLIRRIDVNTLNTKISFALYSTPCETCTLEQQRSIDATRKKILQLCGSGDVHFGCTFVCVLPRETKKPCIVPLIRTKKTYGDDVYFIEQQPGRVYTGWLDYLENNKLPKAKICYPANGFYQTRSTQHFNQRSNQLVDIKFTDTSGKSIIGIVCDGASTVVKVASSVLIGVSASIICPLATPLVIGATAAFTASEVYTVTRGVAEIVDRVSHHEPIGLEIAGTLASIGADVIGTALAGSAAVLPRLVASGRLTSSTATLFVNVLTWTNVGVKSFGVLSNIAIIIEKLRKGNLESADIAHIISCCLFIRNIVINPVMAEKIIQCISKQPSQLGNIFEMKSNTSFSAVKTIDTAVKWEVVIEAIFGDLVVPFMRSVGMKHFAEFLHGIKDVLRQFHGGEVNIASLCVKLQQLLSEHLRDVMDEVAEAWKNTRSYFYDYNFPSHVFRRPSLEASEIVNNAERVIDAANIRSAKTRDISRQAIMGASLQSAINMNAQSERELADMSQMAMDDIRRRVERYLVVSASEGNRLSAEAVGRAALREAIAAFRNEFRGNARSSEMNGNTRTAQNSRIPLLPVWMSEEFDMYIFQVPYRVPEINQFVHDTTCHLLGVDDYEPHPIISEDVPVIVNNSSPLGNTIIFYYEQLEGSDTAIGSVVVER